MRIIDIITLLVASQVQVVAKMGVSASLGCSHFSIDGLTMSLRRAPTIDELNNQMKRYQDRIRDLEGALNDVYSPKHGGRLHPLLQAGSKLPDFQIEQEELQGQDDLTTRIAHGTLSVGHSGGSTRWLGPNALSTWFLDVGFAPSPTFLYQWLIQVTTE
jgi:hypothetical protein